jgi:hypothetical protein
MKQRKKLALAIVLMIALLVSCAGSSSLGGGLWGTLGAQSGVSNLVNGFAAKMTQNSAVASALGAAGIQSAKKGLYNSIAETGGYTIEKGSDLMGVLKGKKLSPDVVSGIGSSLTAAAQEQRVGTAQTEALKKIWTPVEKSLLAGK